MNEHDEIMTENFAERFVDHRNVGLAPQTITKFSLHHRKRGFNVRAFMVVLQELGTPELEVVIHLLPSSAAVAPMVRSERDKRCSPQSGDCFGVALAGVALVSGDFSDLKVLSRTLCQSRKHNGIVRMPSMNLYGSHYVGFDPDHEMKLDPIMLFPNLPVLVVKPASKTAGSETGRIHGKIGLYRLERQTGLRNETLQDSSQFGFLKVIGDAVKVRNLGNVSAPVRFSQIGHETALRNGAVDLECDIEYSIREGESWTTRLGRSRHKTRAQIAQQGLELVLFVSLRLIVGRPILRISGLLRGSQSDALRHSGGALGILLTSHHESGGVNMLAVHPAGFMVGTGARGNLGHQVNAVRSIANLRRNDPKSGLLLNRPGCCQFHSALFSQVHKASAYLRNILLNRYIFVKDKMHLDNILLSSILGAWHWLRSRKKGINAIVASMNGSRERAQSASRESVRHANRRTGISRENITSKRGNFDLSQVWRRSRESNPRCIHTVREFCRLSAATSIGASPLKAASRDIASQTFALYSQCITTKSFGLLKSFLVRVSALGLHKTHCLVPKNACGHGFQVFILKHSLPEFSLDLCLEVGIQYRVRNANQVIGTSGFIKADCAGLSHTFEYGVNRSHRIAVAGKIKTAPLCSFANFCRCQFSLFSRSVKEDPVNLVGDIDRHSQNGDEYQFDLSILRRKKIRICSDEVPQIFRLSLNSRLLCFKLLKSLFGFGDLLAKGING